MGVPGGCGISKQCQNTCLLHIYCYHKTPVPKVKPYKKLNFDGVRLGGPVEVWYPKPCQNICLLNVYFYQKKKLAPIVKLFKKLIWGESIWGDPGGVKPKNYVKIFVC